MTKDTETSAKTRYRVDKFIVPPAAREAFLERVTVTSRLLRAQPGFLRELVLEQNAGPGEFNFVTVAEWSDDAAIEAATEVVARAHAEMGFDRQAFVAEHGIRADIAHYSALTV